MGSVIRLISDKALPFKSLFILFLEEEAGEEVKELEAGIELTLAVFPAPSALIQPGKGALDDPTFGHHLEGVQLAAFVSNCSRGMLL